MEILNGVFRIETGYPRMGGVPLYLYLVRGEQETALIDTGVPGFWLESVEPYLKKLGIPSTSITLILNTHGHPDHFGGNAEVQAATGAKICAPLVDAAWVEDHQRHWVELWEGYPGDLAFGDDIRESIMNDYCGPSTPVDVILRPGDKVDLGGRFLGVIATPGHSPGHVAFYDREQATVFSGDTVQGHGIPFANGESKLGVLYTDVDGYISSLERLLQLKVEYLCGAHGYAHTSLEAEEMLKDSLAYVQEVESVLNAELGKTNGLFKVPDLALRVSSMADGPGEVSLQSVSVVTAHLRRLARQGNVQECWQVSNTRIGSPTHTSDTQGNIV